jgi:hypothetical protein
LGSGNNPIVAGVSVLDQPVRYDQDQGGRIRRQRRALYIAFTVVVTGILALAVLEAGAGTHVYGVDTDLTRASEDGTALSVRFARVTRAQLSVSLKITIQHTSGFDGPVTVAISSDYLEAFDANSVTPEPSAESSNASAVLMTFEPPQGDVLVIDWQMFARPTEWFINRTGAISVVDTNQNPIVTATFHTDIRP